MPPLALRSVRRGRLRDVTPFSLALIDVGGQPAVAVSEKRGLRRLDSLPGGELAPPSIRMLLDGWDRWCDVIERALVDADDQGWLVAEQVVFLPPVADPPTLYCCAANYHEHVAEMGHEVGADADPYHFLIPPAALIGHRQPVDYPHGVPDMLDWEVELAVLIGRHTRNATIEDALDAVAGYTVANDISLRDRSLAGHHPVFGHRWIYRKGRETFKPLGPVLTPARFIRDVANLDLNLTVNGEVRQSSNTSRMVFTVQAQIVHISSMITLLPGDLILTGTPEGTAAAHGGRYLAIGDVVAASVAEIGTLENAIAAPF